MNKVIYILALILFQYSCDNPFSSKDCREEVQMTVREIAVPDSANFFEPMQVKVEVMLRDSGYAYIGPIIENTADGCMITIMGEREKCDFVAQAIGYEWHSFNIRPTKIGEYAIEVRSLFYKSLVETTYVR
jgi:hypothetical protein